MQVQKYLSLFYQRHGKNTMAWGKTLQTILPIASMNTLILQHTTFLSLAIRELPPSWEADILRETEYS